MTLNCWVIVERYPFMNEAIGGSIPIVVSSLYLTGWVGRSQEPTHRKGQHAQSHVGLPNNGCLFILFFHA